jgi:hypothetical protein
MGKRPIFNPSHIQDLMKEFNHIFNHIGFDIEKTMDLNERENNKHSKYENILARFYSCGQKLISMLLV